MKKPAITSLDEPIEYRAMIPVHARFLGDHDHVMARVAALGRQSGRDADWVPEHIDEAIYEALISAKVPDDCAMVFLDPSRATEEATYIASIEVRLLVDLLTQEKSKAQPIPAGFKPTLNALMLAQINADTPPVDLGFEILGHSQPADHKTAHGKMLIRSRVQRCQWTGPKESLFVVPT